MRVKAAVFNPRPAQRKVLRYRRGYMGVLAVPGSGKTQTLSGLAAELLRSGKLGRGQEVLVVTLVNSAVENFSSRISVLVNSEPLFPQVDCRVRTLHGLAHDILRERPEKGGVSEDFEILDDRAADLIREEVAQAWMRSHPEELHEFFVPTLSEEKRAQVERNQLPKLVKSLALGFIRTAKDLQQTPETLHAQLDRLSAPLPLAEIGCALYRDYQRALHYRGAVDFDDLIRLALQVLEEDEAYLLRLRHRWPYILEDEAQDSSRLQEKILRLLAGEGGNWVRVGDPNQAIYETFTTASPLYLRAFVKRPGVRAASLPDSGRSTETILALANELIRWTNSEHPEPEVREALSPPFIRSTSLDDPQPNPADQPAEVKIISRRFTPREEITAVADSIERWLPLHPEETAAALAPRNQRAEELAAELKKRGIQPVESLLRTTTLTRQVCATLTAMLNFLADPASILKMADVYRAWRRLAEDSGKVSLLRHQIVALLRKCPGVEDYLWPLLEKDWLESIAERGKIEAELLAELAEFQKTLRRWQGLALLPIDQVLLSLGQELFQQPAELAIVQKLAGLLGRASILHPNWRQPELANEIDNIARSQSLSALSENGQGFEPDQYKGRVVVATIHKAKGLEWDRVYLMSVNNYDFPSGSGQDQYISEKWFIRGCLNLEAEAIAQLNVLTGNAEGWYQEGAATQRARLDYASERLRLLFVGITRARKELVVTWNSGRKGDLEMALPLADLRTWLEERQRFGGGQDGAIGG